MRGPPGVKGHRVALPSMVAAAFSTAARASTITPMSVAVIIVNYNSAALLQRCVQCLSDQTLAPDKVVIVDNASDDACAPITLDEIGNADLLRLTDNLGYGGAINRALAMLDDMEYVCCLNPDAFPEPAWLENFVRAADKQPGCGSFASLMLKFDEPGIVDGAGDELHFTGIPRRRFHGKRLDDLRIKTEPVFSACAGAAMYRMAALKAVGGFDETLFMYVEDIDLGFRLQLRGYPCLLVSDAVANHIGSATTGERSAFSIYHGHRNLVYSYIKNMPLPLLLATLPAHILANLWTLLVFAFKGSFKNILRAKRDALRMLPAAVRARNPGAQTVRTIYIWRLFRKCPFL